MFRITLFIFTLLITFSSTASDEVSQQDEILDLSGAQLSGDFTLHSSQGEFSLEQLRGKVALLYFGYTKCPDVCPTSLAFLTQALNELSDDELKAVQGVFISVDPKRDNFQVLDDYVSYFHPNLMGEPVVTARLRRLQNSMVRNTTKWPLRDLPSATQSTTQQ